MNPILRNTLVFICSLFAGSLVNMGIITVGPMVIPSPEGADMTTMEGLIAAMPLMEPKHFLAPFLAHALGTLVGAFIAAKLVTTRPAWFAGGVALFFLAGGITNVVLLPSPLWYSVVDIGLAYLPMGFLGLKLGSR